MCTPVSDNIVTFNVSGTSVKIPCEKLGLHPESLLARMAHNKVQPADGFFIACCPKIFGYVLRFVLHNMKLDPGVIANKLATNETYVREVIDGFKFKGIYLGDKTPSVTNKNKIEELYKDIWTLAEKGELDNLKLLVNQGFVLDLKCPKYGSTPLMYACQYGHLDCVRFLIDRGANVNVRNHNGYTPLHFASNVEIVKVLLQKGAVIDAVSSLTGYTPLHYAFIPNHYTTGAPRCQNKDIIRELIINGANMNLADCYGRTPLHLAVKYATDDFIIELITNNSYIEVRTKEGDTLLHFASCKSLNIVKHLLDLGADMNVKNNAGYTPLVVAAKHAKHDIVAEFCKHDETDD